MNKATLSWIKKHGSVEFSVQFNELQLAPQQWCQFDIQKDNDRLSVNALFMPNDLHTVEYNDKSLSVPYGFLAELTEQEIIGLSLPTPAPIIIKIMTEGLFSKPSFKIKYRILNNDKRPILGAKIDGLFLESNTTYTLLEPYYSIIKSIDSFNQTEFADVNERLVALSEIKSLLPDNSMVDSQIKEVTICRADRFTLDIKDNNTFNPLLIKNKHYLEEDVTNSSVVDYAIPSTQQTEFERQFSSRKYVNKSYPIGRDTYVILPNRVKNALEVVKEFQVKPQHERQTFIANPQKYIVQHVLGDLDELSSQEDIEMIDALFVETPDFVSQRIEQIGYWSPKLCAYVTSNEGGWLPTDTERLKFPIDDLLIDISITEAKYLLTLIIEALDNEKDIIRFNDIDVPATIETKNNLIQFLKQIEDQRDKSREENFKKEIKAPLVKDNIDELQFELIKKSPRPKLNRTPGALTVQSLFPHQKVGIDWLCQHWESGSVGALLADDMGLGKTLQALVLMVSVFESSKLGNFKIGPTLIVAPSGLLKNWMDEADLHTSNKFLGDFYQAFGPGIKRLSDMDTFERNQFLSQQRVVLTTYETLRDKINVFLSIEWGLTVFDEAQKIKNPVSRMTEMAKSISSEFSLMLTGTPVENELKDLWSIMDVAQPGLFGSLADFHLDYVLPAINNSQLAQNLKKLLVEKSSPPVMMRRLKEEHIEGLPHKQVHEVWIEMPEQQASEYENRIKDAQGEKHILGAMFKIIHDLKKISLIAENIDGFGIDDGVVNRSARLKALVEILDKVKAKNEKALIFCEHLNIQEHLASYIQYRYKMPTRPFRISGKIDGFTRKKIVDEFQSRPSSEFDVMLLSPKAGGVGLTITAANHVIHLSRWWNPAVEDQSTDRVYRIRQNKEVHVYLPIAVHPKYQDLSFDANLNSLLQQKRNLSLNALMPGTMSKSDVKAFFEKMI